MNFSLSQIPDRKIKPRQSGLTMVMDKGLSVEEARNFMSATNPHVDIIKLGLKFIGHMIYRFTLEVLYLRHS